MTRLIRILVVAGLVSLWALPGQAQNVYEISVDLDSSANGDVNVVQAVLTAAKDGEASSSLRKIAGGVSLEFLVALHSRVDASDVLSLDDGSLVALMEGDTLKVIKKCKDFPCAGATIIWGKGTGHPLAIYIRNAYGECVRSIEWNRKKGSNAPLVGQDCGGGGEIPKG